MRLAVIAALLVALSGGHAAAFKCYTPDHARAEVGFMRPFSQEQRFIGEEAEIFMRLLNAMPPVTQIPGDEVLVFTDPTAHRRLIVTYWRGCRIGFDYWLKPRLDLVLEQIRPET